MPLKGVQDLGKEGGDGAAAAVATVAAAAKRDVVFAVLRDFPSRKITCGNKH